MMQFIREHFLTVRYQYDNPIDRERAQRLLYITAITFITALVWVLGVGIPAMMQNNYGFSEVINLTTPIIVWILITMIQRGLFVWASRIFVAALFLVVIIGYLNDPLSPANGGIILPIIAAGLMLDLRGLMVVTLATILVIGRGLFIPLDNGSIPSASILLSISISAILAAVFIYVFNSSLYQIAARADVLIKQVQSLNILDTTMSNDTDEVLPQAINVIRNQMGYEYVRIILLDEFQVPIRIVYSSIGVERVATTTDISAANALAFQNVISKQDTIQVSQSERSRLKDHLLPTTHYGLVVPAIYIGQMVALFDIQTETNSPIPDEQIDLLKFFIGQVAGTLVYQRAVSGLRNDISEQQVIIEQQRTQLQNIQLQQAEGIVTDWAYYLRQRGLESIGYDIDPMSRISDLQAGNLPEHLTMALNSGDITVAEQGETQIVAIPIRFRDQVLGVMSFEVPIQLPLTERRLEFIRSVTDRLALALDNKRLFEQTQTQAQREGIANEIGTALLSSTDVHAVLQMAADRFNEALGAISTQIYLQPTNVQQADNQQIEDAV